MPHKFVQPLLIIITVSVLLWILFRIIRGISKKNGVVVVPFGSNLIFFLFYIYIVGVLTLTVFPLPFERFKIPTKDGINMVPVVNIVKGFLEMLSSHAAISAYSFQNIFGNIILFIPLGIFLPLLSSKYRFMDNVAILASICSVSIELIQLLLRQFEIYRSVDINDVILNTSGALIGFTLMNKFYLAKYKR